VFSTGSIAPVGINDPHRARRPVTSRRCSTAALRHAGRPQIVRLDEVDRFDRLAAMLSHDRHRPASLIVSGGA
jgi:hypothetical protein